MSFAEVIGQEVPINILQNELSQQRINHAYLFVGQSGIGKELTAYEFAKTLNCKENQLDACGECISCQKFASGNHPDIVHLQPEGSLIKIDQIRSLQQDISYKPYESEWKIYIIPSAEDMSLQAANSLLRTLEEPPHYGVLILLSTKEELLLPTITSRCQIIKFKSLTRDQITDRLISEFDVDLQQAQRIATLANGSLGKAIDFLKQDDTLTIREQVLNSLVELRSYDLVEVFDLAAQILDYKEQLEDMLGSMITFYRDLLLYKEQDSSELVINFDYEADLIELSDYYTISELQRIIELIEETDTLIRETNVNLQLAVEVMLLSIKEKRV
ncbi:MAG: DNA polymerase III subunit delta' [Bacillota bacterium]